MYSLYPHIKTFLSSTIRKLNLKNIETSFEDLVKEQKRFYRTVCSYKDQKVFFKTLLAKEKGAKKRFLNEIKFYLEAQKTNDVKLINLLPRILEYSLNPKFPYLLYQYIPGSPKHSKLSLSCSELTQIIQALQTITQTSWQKFNPNFQKSLNQSFSISFFQYQSIAKFFNLSKELSSKIERILKKAKTLHSQPILVLSHGDFSEANLIFRKGKLVKVVDWEHVGLRFPLYDFCDFWVKRWRYPKEQRFLLKNMNKIYSRKDADLFFQLSLCLVVIKNLKIFKKAILQEGNKNLFKKEIKKHIELLTQYL